MCTSLQNTAHGVNGNIIDTFLFQVRIRIGFYHLHFKEWFRVFPREQFLILKMDNLDSLSPQIGKHHMLL